MNEGKFTDNTSQTWLLDGRPLVFEQDRPQTIALPQHGIKIVAAGGGDMQAQRLMIRVASIEMLALFIQVPRLLMTKTSVFI
ncbi:MAG: hypothetical protein ACTHJ4_02610 [Candidatus Nucleicultricaceae bacterium]